MSEQETQAEQHLIAAMAPAVVDTGAAFNVNTREQLHWVMRKAALAESRIRENRQTMESEIDKIKNWFEAETKGDQRDLEFFTNQAKDYLRRQREADPNVKSLKTPHGTVKSRQPAPTLTVVDASQVPDDYQYTEMVTRISVKELIADTHPEGDGWAVTESGRVISGVRWEVKEPTYTVEVVP